MTTHPVRSVCLPRVRSTPTATESTNTSDYVRPRQTAAHHDAIRVIARDCTRRGDAEWVSLRCVALRCLALLCLTLLRFALLCFALDCACVALRRLSWACQQCFAAHAEQIRPGLARSGVGERGWKPKPVAAGVVGSWPDCFRCVRCDPPMQIERDSMGQRG